MTPEQLFHAIGQAEDDLLESSENHRPQRWRPWRRWAAMAAAACLLLAIGLGVGISLPRPGDGLSNGLAGGGSSSSSAVEDPDQGTDQSGGLASLALDWDTSGGAGGSLPGSRQLWPAAWRGSGAPIPPRCMRKTG